MREFRTSKQLYHHSVVDAIHLVIIHIKGVIEDVVHLGIGIRLVLRGVEGTNIVLLGILKSKATIVNPYGIYREVGTSASQEDVRCNIPRVGILELELTLLHAIHIDDGDVTIVCLVVSHYGYEQVHILLIHKVITLHIVGRVLVP